jgi:hypothetical protein
VVVTVVAISHNKNVKHRYMPAAFRWTRSCVARRLHWRYVLQDDQQKSSQGAKG